MFLGHFAVAMAAKKMDKTPSLGTLFMAAQWLDLLWPVLLLTGTEKVIIEPGNSATTPLNFIHYPVSHSLLAVLGWGLLFAAIYFMVTRNRRGAVVLGLLVLSHWFLDLLVHIPDLPLTPFPGSNKWGLGLWNHKYITLILELALLYTGVYIYLKTMAAVNKTATVVFASLILFLIVIYLLNIFGPPPPAEKPIAIMGLAQWLIVAWGYWADSKRRPVNYSPA